MEIKPENIFLQITPDIIENVRKIYDLDKPGRLEEAINILEEWIQKQDHFIKKDFSKMYLEKTLIACKGSVEKAKKQIDRLCTMKTLLPKFFTKTNVKIELQNILEIAKLIVLPTITEDYYRVVMVQLSNKEHTPENFTEYYQYCMAFSEYIKAYDYVNGFIAIYDCTQLNLLDIILKMNTAELQQFITIIIEGYGARLKSIYLLTESKAIELLVSTVKQVVSEKIGNRMYVLRSIDDLYKVVPKEILPAEYGGNEKSTNKLHAEIMEMLSTETHVEYLKMMYKACTDETKRHTGKFNEEYMGMPGSFRNLSVD